MVLVQDTVLWLGGWDGSDVRDEIYSLNAAVTGHQWEEVATLATPRGGHCSVAWNDSVITAGTTVTLPVLTSDLD